jgi:hypothetical protein
VSASDRLAAPRGSDKAPARGSCIARLETVDVVNGAVIAHPGPAGTAYEGGQCVGSHHQPFKR